MWTCILFPEREQVDGRTALHAAASTDSGANSLCLLLDHGVSIDHSSVRMNGLCRVMCA